MRIFLFICSFLVTVGLIWALKTPLSVGGQSLPAFGDLLNPFTGFWTNAEPVKAFPIKALSPKLKGLKGPVEVVYDDLLVPHIFAQNQEDAFRVQGYILASQRLWQMDMAARRAGGRLAEVVGDRALGSDRYMRRKGMVYAAESSMQVWMANAEAKQLLTAYAEGVNSYIDQMSEAEMPVEYKLLGFKPEYWSPLKTALILENMSDMLASRDADLASTNTLRIFGRETFDYLYPEWNPKQQPVVPDMGQWNEVTPILTPQPVAASLTGIQRKETADPSIGMLGEVPLNDPNFQIGSNNWALSGSRTASGKAMMANDMHLGLSLPHIWFQVQLHVPEGSCYGVCLPGVPGIIVGFNKDLAWGVTNVSHDVSDWYQIRWADSLRTKYNLDGEVKEVRMRYEEITIKGQKEPFRDTVRYTVWGPLTFDHEPDNPLYDCALRWLSHDRPDVGNMNTFFMLNYGKGYDDYKKALPGHDCPAQNFVLATRSGDIAIQVQGRYPLRGKEHGRFVLDGNRWANSWQGSIPQDVVPYLKNPERGFVFSANQHSTPPSYPYYYLGSFDDFRGRRIYDRLNVMANATIDSMKAMQMDNFSMRAFEGKKALLALLDRNQLDATGKAIADELDAWDARYDIEKKAPIYFEQWFDSLRVRCWDEMYALQANKTNVLIPEDWRTIALLESDTANIFFDHPKTSYREAARDIVLESFKAMQQTVAVPIAAGKNWGSFRECHINHLARLAPFSRTLTNVGGHGTSPNANNDGHGPSWRMIVELGDEPKALGVYPGGQSGNPGSRYYDTMLDAWAKGEYFELLLLKNPTDNPNNRIIGKQTFSPRS